MKKFLPLLIVLLAGLTLTGCSLIPSNDSPNPENDVVEQAPARQSDGFGDDATALSESLTATSAATLPNSQVIEGSIKTFTMSEVAAHATKTDCWFVINQKVYDVSPFIASGKHPGGDAILAGCGKDATTLFETRPMGSGTPHSDRAEAGLENFQIGVLAQ